METPREVELKLECEVLDLAFLAAHPLLRGDDASEPALLEATYFDTPENALRKAGLSLRVRQVGGRRVQTLKAASASVGLFDRPEWEWDISGPEPVLDLLEQTPAAGILAEGRPGGLQAVFRTVIERTETPIRYRGSDIAVTLDSGRVETGQGDARLCELELELTAGTPDDLFALAQTLCETVPLHLGALSKGERGYALLDETLRRPSKAARVVLDEDATTGRAFATVAHACLKHLRLNEAVFQHARDPEALHQMRVALRRLRSAFSLFKPMLAGDPTAATLAAEVKRIAEPFGTARNLDVFLSETLAAEIERRPDEPGLVDLRSRLERDRDGAHERVVAVLGSQAWRSLVLDLVAWIEAGAWRTGEAQPQRDRPASDFAAEVLDRLRRRIKKRGRHLDRLEPEQRHRVRIWAKKLRYGAEFFSSVFTGGKKAAMRHKRFVAALSELQDQLGALNDLATAHDIAKDLSVTHDARDQQASGPALFAAGLTAADHEAGSDRLIEAAVDAYEEFLEVRPFWT